MFTFINDSNRKRLHIQDEREVEEGILESPTEKMVKLNALIGHFLEEILDLDHRVIGVVLWDRSSQNPSQTGLIV